MDEISILEELRKFVSGNTIVLLYIAVSITRYILVPLYKGSGSLRDFMSAATQSLNKSATGSEAIATELKALNSLLSEKD